MKKHPYSELKKKRPLFFTIGLTAALALSLLAFEYRTLTIQEKFPDYDSEIERFEEDEIPRTIRKKKVPKLPEPKLLKPAPKPEPSPFVEPKPDPEPEPIDIPNFDSILPALAKEKPVVDDKVYLVPQQSAEYQGGMVELYAFVKQFKMTESFKDFGAPGGKMIVTWVVEKDGTASEIEVLRGLGYGMDEAIIEHLSKMPKWKPAMQGNHYVRQRFHLPLNYSIK